MASLFLSHSRRIARKLAFRPIIQFKELCCWNWNPSCVNSAPLCRKYGTDAHDQDRTTVHILNNENKNIFMINTYSQLGFRLNIGVTVLGSIVLFPQSVLAWMVTSEKDITPESVSLFHTLEPKLDILVIGYGDRGNKIQPSVIQALSRRKIYVETLPTEVACTTYNFLAAEGRYVAAALIPPSMIQTSDDQAIEERIKQRRLFKWDDGRDPWHGGVEKT